MLFCSTDCSGVVPEVCESVSSPVLLQCVRCSVLKGLERSGGGVLQKGCVPARVSAGVQLADSHREEEEGAETDKPLFMLPDKLGDLSGGFYASSF